MGCSFSIGVDKETAKLLATLDDKVKDINDIFIKGAEEAEKEQKKQLENRKKELQKLKDEKKEITEEILKKLNKDELKVELGLLSNQVEKMHFIFDTGLELVPELRKITLDKLLEKAKTAPALALKKINDQIEEIKNIPIIDFLNSTYGKVLKDALAKKGLSDTVLVSFKKELMKSRAERRKAEREEFGIKTNEFEGEDIKQIKLDLFSLIEKEYDESIEKNFKNYIRDKLIENCL